MRQIIKNWMNASFVCRMLNKATEKIASFFRSSAIGDWFSGEPLPTGESRMDRLAGAFINSPLCDFIRSGKLLYWLVQIPEIAWIFLMLTLLGAMVLPTLAVMILALLTLALTLLGLIFGKETMPAVTGGIRVWMLYALITLIYTFVNYGGTKGILAGGIRFVMLPLLPCAWILLGKAKRIWRSLYVLTGATLCVSLYGLYQYLTGAISARWTDTNLFSEDLGRLTSTFENPNVYGTFLLIAVPLVFMGTFFVKNWRVKVLFGCSALLATINLFLTYSRGCYVSLAICLMILLIYKGKQWLWVGVAALVSSPLWLPESVVSRIMSIGNLADSSVTYRISIWKGVMKMLSKYWWMGVGIGDTAFVTIYEKDALTAVEDASHAHNLLLQTMAESGLLGLLILLLLFVFLFRSAASAMRRSQNPTEKWLRLTMIAIWISLLVQGLTDFIFYNNNLFAIMMISLGAMVSNIEPKGKEEGV